MSAHPYLRTWLDRHQLEPVALDVARVRDRLLVARQHYERAVAILTLLADDHAFHVDQAYHAIRAAAVAHSFLSVTEQGLAAIVTTRSNPDCHVVLRGGRGGPNYDAANVQQTLESLRAAGLPRRVMIDASHDNSRKDYRRQPVVAREIAAQIAAGEAGIVGVMLESFLVEGRQDLVDKSRLVYGQSITDSCMSWETTAQVLEELADAVQARRHVRRGR